VIRLRGDLRAGFLGLVAVSTSVGAGAFHLVLAQDGGQALDVVLLLLFTILFLWICVSFWTAALGAVEAFRLRSTDAAGGVAPATADESPLPPTAILLPVFNESATRIAATVRAIRASLAATGHGSSFAFFVLSDTTDADRWVEEEIVWTEIVAEGDGPAVHYRRRSPNVGRKSGNIADWCARWGAAHRYMLVLDADSLMEGATIVEMVRRMERDPRVAILQTPPRLVNQGTFFARARQFASGVYGPMHDAGFAALSGGDANYWGHNALLRVEAYARHCGLPPLPGAPPLGGEILSHDFVEAALLRRAGWRVELAQDLGGSYEEAPATLADHARRDERWCQGNLQHLRLVLMRGFHPASRVHFGTGAMAYVASPLWLVFLVVGLLLAIGAGGEAPWGARIFDGHALALFLTTMAMLLAPKAWAYLLLLRDRPRLAAHGGAARAAASVATETLVSTLAAPSFMLFHTQFVVGTFLGRTVRWTTHRRDAAGTTLAEAARDHGVHTAIGVVASVATAAFAPGLLPWMSPVLAGLVFAIPLAVLLGSPRVGAALRRARLLLTPEETHAPPVVARFHRELAVAEARRDARGADAPFEQAVRDPVVHAVHVDLVRASPASRPPTPARRRRIERIALRRGPSRLTPSDRAALLEDVELLARLHRWVRPT
jgi:membrane glycosyltransferase